MTDPADASYARPEITGLGSLVDAWPEADRNIFRRIYDVSTATGHLHIPETMREWVINQFGSLEAVEDQQVIRITNRWTYESAIFNGLRSRRPTRERSEPASGERSPADSPFAHPETMTPEEGFGRLRGRHATTAGNVALYDGFHGLIIFDEPDPLRIDAGTFVDAIDLACRWFKASHAVDTSAVYPLFTWNCGARAGASIPHAHAQVALGKQEHYGGALRLRDAARRYWDACGGAYFDDLFTVHERLGAGWGAGDDLRAFASLTPVKERETWLLGPEFNERFGLAVHQVISRLANTFGMAAFNLAIYPRPLGRARDAWSDFPVIARVVDRGEPDAVTSDIASMELFAASVVSADPFEVARALRGTPD